MSAADPSPRSRHPRANLCNGRPVEGVLAMLEAGKTQREVARAYGVGRDAIKHHAERHGVNTWAHQRERAAKLRTARAAPLKEVARLSGVCTREARIAFVLRHREEFSAAEIGDALGISRNAVLGILWRARSGK